MSCRFPGKADNPNLFWHNIAAGLDAITPIPESRWPAAVLDRQNCLSTDDNFARVGGFIENIYGFDSGFFGISPREAHDIDPQQRLLLELAWRAMEDAAVSPDDLSKCSTGVFVGVINHDHARARLANQNTIGQHTGLGRSASIAANRISFTFNFGGPSVTIDTACSASLVAVDYACQSLKTGDSDLALAGGANAILLPESYLEFARAQMLSAKGACRAFDAVADGFVRAEGGGMLLLKRLTDALVDNDRIRGVILSTAVNQDGKTSGLMAPSASAQQELMHLALRRAGINASDVGFVESHGTGTQSGDTAEALSIGKIYGRPESASPCPVGSVKTNIGHTESAAGIAGLIKVIGALESRLIPPNLHFSNPNPDIDFDALGICVPTHALPWDTQTSRIAAVNSFGFGGTNAHAIVAEAPTRRIRSQKSLQQSRLIPLTAPTSEQLNVLMHSVKKSVTDDPVVEVDQLCYTAGRRQKFESRCVIELTPNKPIPGQITVSESNGEDIEAHYRISSNLPPKLIFVFSGMGAKTNRTGRQLYQCEPRFRSVVDQCDLLFRELHDINACGDVLAEKQTTNKRDLDFLQPLQFAVQMGLFELWTSWGLQPQTIVGHSVGETAAACAAGAISLIDGVNISATRSRIMQQLDGTGAMLAVAMSPSEATKVCLDHPDQLFVASVNSRSSVTFSGTEAAIDRLARMLKERDVFHRRLIVRVPLHTPLIDDLEVQVMRAVDTISPELPRIEWRSSIPGFDPVSEIAEPKVWWNNFRAPAEFNSAVLSCLNGESSVWIEISHHPAVSVNISETFREAGIDGLVVSSLNRNIPDRDYIRFSAGKLFQLGFDLDWTLINGESDVVDFPETTLNNQNYGEDLTNLCDSTEWSESLDKNTPPHDESFDHSLTVSELPWLKHHTLDDLVVFPAAGYIDLALQAAQQIYDSASCELSDLEFSKLASLGDLNSITEPVPVRVTVSPNGTFQKFNIHVDSHTSPIKGDGSVNASGLICLTNSSPCQSNPNEILSRCCESMNIRQVKSALESRGFAFFSNSWKFDNVAFTPETESLVRIEQVEPLSESGPYAINPGLLDLCFRTAAVCFLDEYTYVPIKINTLRFSKKPSSICWCHAHNFTRNQNNLILDLDLIDDAGTLLLQVKGFELQRYERRDKQGLQNSKIQLLQPIWQNSNSTIELIRNSNEHKNFRRKLHEYCNELSQRHDRDSYYNLIKPVFNQLTIVYILDALHDLGLTEFKNEPFTIQEIGTELGITETNLPLFHSLFDLLEQHEIIQCIDGRLRFSNKFEHTSANAKWREAMSSSWSAQYLPELLLIERCGRNLSRVLQGATNGLDVVFPEGSISDVRRLYLHSPICKVHNELMARAVELVMVEWSSTRPCRILEMGAGTGALLTRLDPVLCEQPVNYVFTDISSQFLRHARKRFKHLNYVEFREFDMDASPEIQGLNHGAFDLIVATDSLHTARYPEDTLRNIKRLLNPTGGMLIFAELTNEPSWARTTFGLLPSWWHRVRENHSAKSPCYSEHQWHNLLDKQNFLDTTSISESSSDNHPHHTLFISRGESDLLLKQNVIPNKDSRLHSEETWIIFVDNSQFCQSFAQKFSTPNLIRVLAGDHYSSQFNEFWIRPHVAEDYERLFNEVKNSASQIHGIVYLWGVIDARLPCTFADNYQLATSACTSAVKLLQTLDRLSISVAALSFVTANAESHSDYQITVNPLAALSWGFLRSARAEYPSVPFSLIDIDYSEPKTAEQLFSKLTHKSYAPTDSLLSNGELLHLKFRDIELASPHYTDSKTFKVASNHRGDINELAMQTTNSQPLDDDQVRILVSVSSLNFRDLMVALNALPENQLKDSQAGDKVGLECSGTIIEVGDNVQHLNVGDRIVALAAGSLGSEVVADARFTFALDDETDFESVAGIPTAYITSELVLSLASNCAKSTSILIHTASGGVGLALVFRSLAKGYTVYATAGTLQKREFLLALGVHAAFDSRTASFADEIAQLTNGRGVDVVVNTLGGNAALASSEIVRDGGIFIELGKYETKDAVKANLLTTNPTSRYHLLDVDAMWSQFPDELSNHFSNVVRQFIDGEISSLPYQAFAATQIGDAFRYMKDAEHIGKVLVSFEGSQSSNLHLPHDSKLFSNGSCLIAGGTRGFGLATARWLAENGAQSLILISRSPNESSELADAKEHFNKLGTKLNVLSIDIGDLEQLQSGLESVLDNLPPLRTVFQCAMDIADGLLQSLSDKQLHRVLKPKVQGSWNLYLATKNFDLDAFILYSSMTSLVGPPGQAAYAAANSFQNAFANYLRCQGVPAYSISWGAVSDHGYVADNPESVPAIRRYGVEPRPAKLMLENLRSVLSQGTVVNSIIAAGNFAENYGRPEATQAATSTETDRSGIGALQDLNGNGKNGLETQLRHCICKVTGFSEHDVDLHKPIYDFGIDSLFAVELSHLLRIDCGIEISAQKLLEHTTLNDILKQHSEQH